LGLLGCDAVPMGEREVPDVSNECSTCIFKHQAVSHPIPQYHNPEDLNSENIDVYTLGCYYGTKT